MLLKRREFEMVSRQEIEKTEELKKCNFYDPHFRGSFKLHFQPRRATKNSAAYDLYSPIRIVLKPGEIAKIPTGFKIKMPRNEAFFIYIRSSYGAKDIILPAGVNIIDADYYNNPKNEGHFFICIKNNSKLCNTVDFPRPLTPAKILRLLNLNVLDLQNTLKFSILISVIIISWIISS